MTFLLYLIVRGSHKC